MFIYFKEKFRIALPIQKKKKTLLKKTPVVSITVRQPWWYPWYWQKAVLIHKQPLHHQVALPTQPAPALQQFAAAAKALYSLKCLFETGWLLQRKQHQAQELTSESGRLYLC